MADETSGPGQSVPPADESTLTAAPGVPQAQLTARPGDRFGHYKILEEIGQGGCGVVFVAEQEQPVRRRVALKVVKLGMDTRQVIGRFEAERQALAMMDHPNIAKVLDAGATDTGRPFFVMELVKGIRITEYCDQHNLSTADRLKLFIQVCQAVQHAHQKGIIHRDLKPSNILVTLHDGVPVPKVIDFGIAKATAGQKLTDKTVYTALEQFIGTPAYMSPEQAEMTSLDIDTRSDIYSLGVLLYELLTGETPFNSEELLAQGIDAMRRTLREKDPARPSTRLSTMIDADLTAVAQHRQSEPPKLIKLVRGDLDWIVMKCLEKDRTRRYETTNGLAMDIQRHLANEPVVARPPSNVYRFQKLVGRNKLPFATAGAIVVTLLVGLGISTWSLAREKKAHQSEEAQRERAEADEKKAQAEAAKSEQVARFLKQMLQGVEPSVALGRDTTMLREILDKTSEHVQSQLASQPEVEAELLSTICNAYLALGESRKAEQAGKKALELRQNVFGPEHPTVAASLHDLGTAVMYEDRNAQAERLLRQALAMRRKLVGNNAFETAQTLYELGCLMRQQQKWADAEPLHREALTIRQRISDQRNPDVTECMIGLAFALQRQHKYGEAEALYREALRMRTDWFGTNSPAVADSFHNLSLLLWDTGRRDAAIPMMREAAALRQKLLNADNPVKGESYFRLGEFLGLQGHLAESEAAWRQALQVPRSKLQDKINHDISGFICVLQKQGKLDEVEKACRQYGVLTNYALCAAISLRFVNAFGGSKDLVAAAEWERKAAEAQLQWDRNSADAGNVAVQNSLARRLATDPDPKNRNGSNAVLYAEKAVAATGRTNASYLDTLAAANAEAGQFAKAVNIQQQALALSQSEPEKRDLASRLELYSSAIPYHDDGLLAARTSNLLAAGRFAEAEPLARECLALCEKRIPDDWRTFNARSMLGGVLLGQKRFAEAEPLLLSGYQGMQQRRASIPTAGGTRLQEAIQRLVELYARTDRPELAVPLLAEASTANPEDTLLAMKVAASQAWLRQDADYAVTRQRMLNAGANATTAEAAERIARLACIRPLADPSQREAALALARKAVELGNGSPNFPWYQLALGIAKYRSGLYAEATAALTAVPGSFVANTWKPNQVEVAANFYRAMSLFKKGMPDEARAIFTATEAKMTPFPADDKIPLAGNAYYHDDLFLWLACKEAKALLNPPSAPQP